MRVWFRRSFFAVLALIGLLFSSVQAQSPSRSQVGLQVFYDFSQSDGSVIQNQAQDAAALELAIADPTRAERKDGLLKLTSPTELRSAVAAKPFIQAVKKTGELTIEAWVQTANQSQQGPARILTLSKDSSNRNFTLGQDGDRFDVRLRTTKTGVNGIPSLAAPAGSIRTEMTHVAYTHDRGGRSRLFLNGDQVAESNVGGSLSNWDESYRLGIGDEVGGGRPWLGSIRSVALYNRALSADEVVQNRDALHTPPNSGAPAGLQVLYNFQRSTADVLKNQAAGRPSVDLKIANMKQVAFADGSLRLHKPTIIRSTQPAQAFVKTVKQTGELTVEAWLQTADKNQQGPARILTLSQDSVHRNFTLGQDGDHLDVRLRTTKTGDNGLPSLAAPTGSLGGGRTHVVYTHSRDGQSRIYLNGKQVAQQNIEGSLANWGDSFHLAIGDELTGDRPWLGTLHLVALYDRALPADEVTRHFAGGPVLHSVPDSGQHRSLELFDTRVASLLANRCLECHDTANRRGDLDLSRKSAALAGGDSGDAIIPGKPDESLVWTSVESDEMPHNRDPLSREEKDVLKAWIASGAQWSIDSIDPALYVHEDLTNQQWVQRLTVDEYIQTVRATVGVDIADDARRALPPDLRADGFSNTAYNLNVDLKHIEGYAGMAQRIVDQMDVDAFAKRFTNSRKLIDDNMRKLVADMGHWVLRGPLEPHEVDLYRGISTTVASAGGDFTDAVRYILYAMLQSPRFIYRIEQQPQQGGWPVGDHELASRMSYILWGASPDEELLKAAQQGKLNFEQSAQQVDRMLNDPRAAQQAAQFATEWLNLRRLQHMQPNSQRFPNWSSELAEDMRQETLTFFQQVAWESDRPLSELLNAQETFVTERLAKHYRLPGKREALKGQTSADGTQWYRVNLQNDPSRGGLLTQGSVLTVGGDDASMVSRGLFLMHDLLRGVVKDPPPCVNTTPVPSKKGVTQRMIATQRIENNACGGCHMRFEPLAFGLERYDGLGTFNMKDEHGNELREDGSIQIPGQSQPLYYDNVQQLTDLLAGSQRVQESICWKLAQFAAGRPLTAADAATMQKIYRSSSADGGTYRDVIKAVVLSDLVRKTKP